MKYFAAMEALRHGVDVCHETWPPTQFYRLSERGLALCQLDFMSREFTMLEMMIGADLIWGAVSRFDDGWAVYSPPTIH